VKIFDFAHRGFRKLRAQDGITREMMIESVKPENNFHSAERAEVESGKSGSFFFYTRDNRFIIKTMFTKELHEMMLNIEKYFEHLSKNERSLMGRIYGIFQV
jgi:1-phosphatidylinositol-4-phosphate 5-kinase